MVYYGIPFETSYTSKNARSLARDYYHFQLEGLPRIRLVHHGCNHQTEMTRHGTGTPGPLFVDIIIEHTKLILTHSHTQY